MTHQLGVDGKYDILDSFQLKSNCDSGNQRKFLWVYLLAYKYKKFGSLRVCERERERERGGGNKSISSIFKKIIYFDIKFWFKYNCFNFYSVYTINLPI